MTQDYELNNCSQQNSVIYASSTLLTCR